AFSLAYPPVSEAGRNAAAGAAAAGDVDAPSWQEVRVLQCAGTLRARGAEGARGRGSFRRRVYDRAHALSPEAGQLWIPAPVPGQPPATATLYHGGRFSRQSAHRRPARHEDSMGDPGAADTRLRGCEDREPDAVATHQVRDLHIHEAGCPRR